MKNSSRFFLIIFPALMVIIALVVVAALWNRSPNSSTPPDAIAETSSSVAANSEEKIIFAPGNGTLSGVILTPDGQPNSTPATLHYRTERWNSENHRSGASGTLATDVTDSFSYEIPAGITTIIAEADGFAISSVGPFENYAGKSIDDIEFRLVAGKPLTIHLQDPKGNPITEAELSGSSQIDQRYPGNQKAKQPDPGRYEFPHVAASTYRVRCSAPGFEPTEFEVESPQNAAETVVLTPGIPTTGVVLDAGGQLVPKAKLLLLYRHPNHYYGGQELGEADEHGEFLLLNLSREHQYSGIVQAPDGRCGTFENLKPGQTELTLHITNPPRLTGTVHGNLEELSRRNRKRAVRINQRVPFGLLNGSESIPYNGHAPVETQDDKQTFTFNGLLTNDWELIAGDVKYQHDGREGDVHLDINLEMGEVTVNPDSTPVEP